MNMTLSIVLRVFIWSIGIFFFSWGYFDVRFRNAEGFLNGTSCLPMATGVALMILGYAVSRRWRRFGFWFALALIGHAVALQLIDAGPLIHYQHYKSLESLISETHPMLIIYLGVQTALVVAGFKTRWLSIRGWVYRTFKLWQLLSIILVFVVSSAALSRDIPVYVAELFFAAFVQTVNLGNIVLMVWALPEKTLAGLKQTFEGLLGQPGVEDRGSEIQNPKPVLSEVEGAKFKNFAVDRFTLLAAVWVTILAAVLSFFVYERHPHIQDEVIYLYHARYLADGKLTVPAPPVPDAFSIYMAPYKADRWYSIFPPGWPAILALGVLFGVPWLVNPILAGVNVLLTFVLMREIYDIRTARLGVLLLCVSPWYVFMGMNFMAHTLTLTWTLAGSLALAWARKTNRASWGWVSGIATGMVSLTRPLDGLAVAGLLGLWAIGVGGRRLKSSSIAAFFLGAIVVGAVILPYNKWLTGDPLVSPLSAYYDSYYGPKTNALGFGPERGLGWALDAYPGHSPIEALINATLNTFSVNVELFGWSTGSLIMVALLAFSGAMQRADYLMIAVIATVLGLYSLYWFSGGPDFGARYWYLMVVPLAVLSARGVQVLERTLECRPCRFSAEGTRVIAAVISSSLLALTNFFPWRALDKYHSYLQMRPDVRHLAKEYGFGKSLILIRGNSHPDYASAWAYNPLNVNADAPVYAWDRDPNIRARILEAYPDRPVWIVNGPSITRGGFKVIQGPLSAGELLAKENVP